MIHIVNHEDLERAGYREFQLCERVKTEQRAIQMPESFAVETQHGTMVGREGDYLMEGVTGQLYIVGKDEFARCYVIYK